MRHSLRKPSTLAAAVFVSLSTVALPAARPADVWRPAPLAAASNTYEVLHGLRVAMRDGTRLSADVYVPQNVRGPFPTILVRTPYDKTGPASAALADLFATRGYALIVEDKRGRFESEGEYVIGWHEISDAYDTLEWITHQAWSNGRVGAYGCSDPGDAVIYDVVSRHPALKAAIPEASGSSMGAAGGWRRYFGVRNDGAVELAMGLGWMTDHGTKHFLTAPGNISWEQFMAMRPGYKLDLTPPKINFDEAVWALPTGSILKDRGLPDTDWDATATEEMTGSFFSKGDYLKGDEQIDTPTLNVNSWYDFAPGVTLSQRAMFERNASTPVARANQFALMSPSLHCNSTRLTPSFRVGARNVGDPSYDVKSLYLMWFDHWLKGVNNGVTDMPKIQYYMMGENRWRGDPAWPPQRSSELRLYLAGARANGPAAAGLLTEKTPPDGYSAYSYDPAKPTPTVGGSMCCVKSDKLEGAYDQREVEARPDVLTFSTPKLKQAIRLAGPVEVVLRISSDRPDTDFTAKLVDVYPDGTAYNLLEGILRARYRDGFEVPRVLEPGRVYTLRIPMQDIANDFGPGHRIRLEISSSSFPRFDRNLNTGGPIGREKAWNVAHNRVWFGGAHLSYVSMRTLDER